MGRRQLRFGAVGLHAGYTGDDRLALYWTLTPVSRLVARLEKYLLRRLPFGLNRRRCGEGRAAYKVPAHWAMRSDPMPRNAVGKRLKNGLTGEAEQRFVEE